MSRNNLPATTRHKELIEAATDDWDFELYQMVHLTMSGESGFVIGASMFAYKEDEYLVRYVDAKGCQRTGTFGVSELRSSGTIH